MSNLGKHISVVETIPYIPGECTSKRYLPKTIDIANDYNNPYYGSVCEQIIMCTDALSNLGGLYV